MNLTRSLVVRNLVGLGFLVPLLVSVRASADEACGDTVCPKGFTCGTFSVPCPDIPCAEGSSCRQCEPQEAQACVPAPCTADTDCADGMVCVTETREECVGGAPCVSDDRGDADDGGDSEPAPDGGETPADCDVEPETCTTMTVSSCAPRWALPCETAADCGPGFTCEEQLQGGCSGSPGSAGGGTPIPPDAGGDSAGFAAPSDGGAGDCFFEPSGVFACVAEEVACTTNADCLDGWTCDANNEGACWSSSDGSSGCDPVDPANLCYPPYYDLGGGFGADNDSGGETAGPGRGDSEGPPGTGQGAGADSGSDSDDGQKADDGGCSVSLAGSTSSGFGLLTLSLLGLFAARRRAVAARG